MLKPADYAFLCLQLRISSGYKGSIFILVRAGAAAGGAPGEPQATGAQTVETLNTAVKIRVSGQSG